MSPFAARRRFSALLARRLALLVAAALAAWMVAGCGIFPQGAYWGVHNGRPSENPSAAPCEPRPPETAAPSPQEEAALRTQLQKSLTARWGSEDLASSAREMKDWIGLGVYSDVMETVVTFYVEPVSYRQLVVAGLESLRAALDNADFLKQFPEAADAAKRERFAQALDILLLKARAADPWFASQAADWVAIVMEKNRAILGLPDGAIVAEFLFGAMDSLDRYSRYLTPEMLRIYEDQMAGRYVGIGAEVTSREGRLFMKVAFEGGAAAKAGLKVGDEITAVEGQSVAGLSIFDLGRKLRGKAGTKVNISVRTGGQGEPREVELVRAVIYLPPVRDAQMLDAERGIAYVRLTEFQDGCADLLGGSVEKLAKQGAKKLILDLRDNPGGSLIEAVYVAGMFLHDGPVVSTRGRALGATWKYDVPWFEPRAWDGPLVILVNEDSASAAELLASALTARDRATAVGRHTYGKGAVQIYFPADWGAAAVSLTIARVWDAKGQCLDGRGVTPQVKVAVPASAPGSLRDDPDVRAAMGVFQRPAP